MTVVKLDPKQWIEIRYKGKTYLVAVKSIIKYVEGK